VIGDEIREGHCFMGMEWEGAESREIRESEDLPGAPKATDTWKCPVTRKRAK